jgi:hypothetical protein
MIAITAANVITVWIASIWVLFLLDYATTQERPDVRTMLLIVIGGPILLIAFIIFCVYDYYKDKNKSPYRK